jgi:hypothetical protein
MFVSPRLISRPGEFLADRRPRDLTVAIVLKTNENRNAHPPDGGMRSEMPASSGVPACLARTSLPKLMISATQVGDRSWQLIFR